MRAWLGLAVTAALVLVFQNCAKVKNGGAAATTSSQSRLSSVCDASGGGLCVEYLALNKNVLESMHRGCTQDGLSIPEVCPVTERLEGYCEFPDEFSPEGVALKRTFHYYTTDDPNYTLADERALKEGACAMNKGTWYNP